MKTNKKFLSLLFGLVCLMLIAPSPAWALLPPTLSFWHSSSTITLGEHVTLSYSVGNAIACTASVDPLSVGAGSWYGSMPFEDGSYHREITPQAVGTKTYILECYNSDSYLPGSAPTTKSLTVTVQPSSVNKIPVANIIQPASDQTINSGATVNFSGSGTDTDGSINGYEWRLGGCDAGTLIYSGTNFTRSFASSATVYLKVRDNKFAWSTNCPARMITVNGSSPTCTASYDKASISSGELSTLTWRSTGDADGRLEYSCTNFSEGNLNPCVGGYCGTISYNGVGRSGLIDDNSYGSANWDSLDHDTSETCTFTAENASGQKATCSDKLVVNKNVSCTASYDKESISSGESATLTWNSTGDADGKLEYSCTNFSEGNLNPCVGGYCGTISYNGVGRSGLIKDNDYGIAVWDSLGRNTSETCTFTAENVSGQKATCSDTLAVNDILSCTASYDKASIASGESATLTWRSTGDMDGRLEYSCTYFSEPSGGWETSASGYNGVATYNGLLVGRSGLIDDNNSGYMSWDSLNHNTSETCTFTAENELGQKVTCSDTLLISATATPPVTYSCVSACLPADCGGPKDLVCKNDNTGESVDDIDEVTYCGDECGSINCPACPTSPIPPLKGGWREVAP